MDRQGRHAAQPRLPNDWQTIAKTGRAAGTNQSERPSKPAAGRPIWARNWPRGWAGTLALGHPAYVAKQKRSPDKSDFSDSQLLADLTRVGYLPRVYLPGGHERDLRQLVNHRQALVDSRRAVKLQHRRRPAAAAGEDRPERISRWSKAWIDYATGNSDLSADARWILEDLLDDLAHLNEKVLRTDARLREATANDQLVERLMEEPGIGEVTAWVLRAYIGSFDRFATGKQLSRYCGLSPCNATTGEKQADAGLIDGCNKLLRATLIQAAHRLVRTRRAGPDCTTRCVTAANPPAWSSPPWPIAGCADCITASWTGPTPRLSGKRKRCLKRKKRRIALKEMIAVQETEAELTSKRPEFVAVRSQPSWA